MSFAHQDATDSNDYQIVAQGTDPWIVSVGGAQSTKKTFVLWAKDVAIGNNKSMVSLLNASGSGVVVRVEKLFLVNTQNSSVTGVNGSFSLFRMTGHSVGTTLTPQSHDTSDTLNVSVTARTGGTIAGESASELYRWKWGTDEWSTGPADAENFDHAMQSLIPLYLASPNEKQITIRPGEGLTLKQTVNSTSGTFDIGIVFTEASA